MISSEVLFHTSFDSNNCQNLLSRLNSDILLGKRFGSRKDRIDLFDITRKISNINMYNN